MGLACGSKEHYNTQTHFVLLLLLERLESSFITCVDRRQFADRRRGRTCRCDCMLSDMVASIDESFLVALLARNPIIAHEYDVASAEWTRVGMTLFVVNDDSCIGMLNCIHVQTQVLNINYANHVAQEAHSKAFSLFPFLPCNAVESILKSLAVVNRDAYELGPQGACLTVP